MKKPDLRFLTNKLFLSGFITGILISAIAVTLVILTAYPAPDEGIIKGTMAGTYVPAVGEVGSVQGSGIQCNYEYSDVIFNNDPNHTVIRCHSDASPTAGMQVEVVSVNNGAFCAGGGIYLSVIPATN